MLEPGIEFPSGAGLPGLSPNPQNCEPMNVRYSRRSPCSTVTAAASTLMPTGRGAPREDCRVSTQELPGSLLLPVPDHPRAEAGTRCEGSLGMGAGATGQEKPLSFTGMWLSRDNRWPLSSPARLRPLHLPRAGSESVGQHLWTLETWPGPLFCPLSVVCPCLLPFLLLDPILHVTTLLHAPADTAVSKSRTPYLVALRAARDSQDSKVALETEAGKL